MAESRFAERSWGITTYVVVADSTMGGDPQTTLAIVTKDRFYSTVETLLQLDFDAFAEILVVDDSEADTLREWCASKPVTWVRGPGVNIQAARNEALSRCTSEYISFVDDDVLLPTDFGSRVVDAFDSRPEAVAVGGPTLSNNVEDARNLCYREKMSVNPYTGTVHDDSYRWEPKDRVRVGLLKGANMSFRADVLRKIGGFNPRFGGPAQREETDVMVRIGEYGEIVYDPDLVCFHKQLGSDAQSSDGEFDEEFIEWRFRNHGYFVARNFGMRTWLLGLFSILLRVCGNPESLMQLVYRRLVLAQKFSVVQCFVAYREGLSRAANEDSTEETNVISSDISTSHGNETED